MVAGCLPVPKGCDHPGSSYRRPSLVHTEAPGTVPASKPLHVPEEQGNRSKCCADRPSLERRCHLTTSPNPRGQRSCPLSCRGLSSVLGEGPETECADEDEWCQAHLPRMTGMSGDSRIPQCMPASSPASVWLFPALASGDWALLSQSPWHLPPCRGVWQVELPWNHGQPPPPSHQIGLVR